MPTSPTTVGTSPVCESIDEFESSLSDIAKPSTVTGGKSSVQAALDSVKTSLSDLKANVTSDDKPKVDALESAISDLQDAIDNLDGVSGIGAVTSAATDVADSGEELITTLKAGC